MNALVLGIDHEIQKVDAWRTGVMKAAYRDLLTKLVGENGIQFICEEASPDDETVGAQIANQLGLPLKWQNIDMSEYERRAEGILEEQRNRAPIVQQGTVETHLADEGFYVDLNSGSYEFNPRIPSDAVREGYMFEQAVAGADGAKSILVLCGNIHVEELARRFRDAGHIATTDALYKYDWYDSR